MPRKVRDLIRDLKKAGFIDRGGKGSHRNFVHPKKEIRAQHQCAEAEAMMAMGALEGVCNILV